MLKLVFFAASLLIFSAVSQAQNIYFWRDVKGVPNYSDTPPPPSPSTVPQPVVSQTVLPQPRTGLRSVIQPDAAATTAVSATPAPSDTTAAAPASSAPAPSGTSPLGQAVNATLKFSYTFDSIPLRSAPGTGPSNDGVWWVEQKEGVTNRATIVNVGRDGSTAVRLHTEPGDTNICCTAINDRNDLALPEPSTGGQQGAEQVWEHSILFPDDFVSSPPGWYAVFDFHNRTGSQGGQANFHIDVGGNNLYFRGYGGRLAFAGDVPGNYGALIGPVVKNQWYDFVYHVKWSAGGDGFFRAWVNGVQKLNHSGPTLYQELNGAVSGVFLKLANYHAAFGLPTSVIHDRVIRYDVVQ